MVDCKRNQKIAEKIRRKSIVNLIEPREYDIAVNKLRDFFRGELGFIETPVQQRLSILAACEDPFNVAPFMYRGRVWPLPHTGQMWLEYEMLKNPDAPGYYCISTSYRDEPEPEVGRHDLIFPMFEFEMSGDMAKLEKVENELLKFLGFRGFCGCEKSKYHVMAYEDVLKHFNLESETSLTSQHEKMLEESFGPVFFLKNFPEYTSPFWNMKREGDLAKKIDVILYGIETIGSAERSCDPDEMRERFHNISDGAYAKSLFARFTREKVEEELEEFLSFDFIERCGGGIGMTRFIRALKCAGIIT